MTKLPSMASNLVGAHNYSRSPVEHEKPWTVKKVLEIPTYQNFFPSNTEAIGNEQLYQNMIQNPSNANHEVLLNQEIAARPQGNLLLQDSIKQEQRDAEINMQKYHGKARCT